MNALAWVAVLMAIGLAVMVLEVFVPSGGILGFVSVAALVAALATAFVQIGLGAGMAVLAITVLAVPAVLGLAFRWFPETPLGRRVLPPPPDPADVLPDAMRRRRLRELVGRSGLAVNELLPWGGVDIGGKVFDAMSESGPIASGTVIEVVGVQGTSLIVRRVEAGGRTATPAVQPAQSDQPDRTGQTGRGPAEPGRGGQAGDSPLSPTLETFEFEQIAPPPA